MWRVENPGRNKTNFCPSGVTGSHNAHANHPPAANTARKINVKNARKFTVV